MEKIYHTQHSARGVKWDEEEPWAWTRCGRWARMVDCDPARGDVKCKYCEAGIRFAERERKLFLEHTEHEWQYRHEKFLNG